MSKRTDLIRFIKQKYQTDFSIAKSETKDSIGDTHVYQKNVGDLQFLSCYGVPWHKDNLDTHYANILVLQNPGYIVEIRNFSVKNQLFFTVPIKIEHRLVGRFSKPWVAVCIDTNIPMTFEEFDTRVRGLLQ